VDPARVRALVVGTWQRRQISDKQQGDLPEGTCAEYSDDPDGHYVAVSE
jgi:hypothetical protein